MKILLFSGGFPEYMIELANAMSELEEVEKVMLLLPDFVLKTPYVEQLSAKVDCKTIDYITYISIRQNIKMAFALIDIIKKFNPDILHIQANGHPWFGLVVPFLPKKCKLVNTIHDPELHIGDKASSYRDYRFAKWMCKRRASAYIVHGENLKKQLTSCYKLKAEKISIIPHGHLYMYKKFQLQPKEEQPYQVLFFGRIWEYKGLKYLMQAEPIIRKVIPELKIVIAGTGEELSIYDEFITNKDSYIIKNYRIKLEEVADLFDEAALVVLPYIEATQSGVIPVAYPFGKPVVATAVGALPEVVVDGETGYLVPAADPQALADKIIYLLQNPDIRHKMGAHAQKYSEEKLNWSNIARATIEVYKNC